MFSDYKFIKKYCFLVLDITCESGKRGREGAGQLNSSTGFKI